MDKISCAERIAYALTVRKMTQTELCKKTGIPKSAMSQYIKGSFEPKQNRVYLISKALDVSEAWLMGYDVPMKKEAPTSESVLTDYELEVIKLLRTVPEDKREDFLNYLQAAVNMLK